MSQRGLLQDVWEFLRERKAWWLLPAVVMLFLMGILVVASQVPYLAPFVYALF
jgi:drug/metabolite transporter superfamily protein YnfA